jgi:ABC-type branched-subunit amino acid transport system ATPase component
VLATAVAVGLLTGLAVMLLAADLDGLWGATVKRNYSALDAPFSYAAAWRDFKNYFRGELAVEHRAQGWLVVTADGRAQLSNDRDAEAARAARDRLQAVVSRLAGRPAGELQEDGSGAYSAMIGGEATPLGHFAAAALAQRQLDKLAAIAAGQRPRMFRIYGGALFGFAIGLAGTLSVWRRSRSAPEVVALAGIGRTFQNIRLFRHMTVLENVLVACDRQLRAAAWQMALRTPTVVREEAAAAERAGRLLAFVGLAGNYDSPADSLPYGDQRRLEIARSLAAEPTLLMLDEPAAGMNPAESAALTRLIGGIRDRGLTVLLIEHHMRVVMGISDRIAVLDYGVKIGEGTPQEVRNNPDVIKAYLGDEEVT